MAENSLCLKLKIIADKISILGRIDLLMCYVQYLVAHFKSSHLYSMNQTDLSLIFNAIQRTELLSNYTFSLLQNLFAIGGLHNTPLVCFTHILLLKPAFTIKFFVL
jgi:hypothetical protein